MEKRLNVATISFKRLLSREGFVSFGLVIGTIFSIVELVIYKRGSTIFQISLIALIYYIYNKFFNSHKIIDNSLEKKANMSLLEKKSLSSYELISWIIVLFFLIGAFILNNIFIDRYYLITSLLLIILFSTNLKMFIYASSLPLIKCKVMVGRYDAKYSNNQIIEKISNCRDIFMDIRGVVTNDKYFLENIHASNPKFVLQIASSLMQNDDHSLSQAIKLEAETKEISKHYISHINKFQGMGITGRINDENFAIGNMKLMKEVDIVVGVLLREKIKLENQGKTVLVLAKTPAIKKNYERNPGEVIGLLIFNCSTQANYVQMNNYFVKQEIDLTYLSGEEKSTLLTRVENISNNKIISDITEMEKKNYIENRAEKQKDKIFIQISKKLVFENSNIVNFIIDKPNQNLDSNSLLIDQYNPTKLIQIYENITKYYKKASFNYQFSWIYQLIIMILSISVVRLSNSNYLYLVSFLLSILAEQIVIRNTNIKHKY
ncbi:MAG: Cation transport ATPase [Berkelbacteria bacterium GW2011_GWA2_35_9]|uniref:Cation transport ATPase n=1 Tax=Berkelbacteria bacterium GW2011_GWA2_35_9 TaxID=1618333 RepID=A0A0G0GAP7_9BACT|nr:MAG: Cation transport ATPase [Berkelbacteria bacterium GW2011_GWA2_35_9]